MPEKCYDYRVTIEGPGFRAERDGYINNEIKWDDYECASEVVRGALAMVANELPYCSKLLAETIAAVIPRDLCDYPDIRDAEERFVEAAEQLVAAWRKLAASHD